MSSELKSTLEEAFKQCNGYLENKKFPYIYSFTTENISGYIDLFDLKNKSLLTVGSSGDQVINAILNGCSDISVVDINIYTKYYYYLKIAAILCLEREELFKFLKYTDYPIIFFNNPLVFNEKYFNRISDTLKEISPESFIFWNSLFSSFNRTTIRENMFSSDEVDPNSLSRINNYLKDDSSYLSAREKILEVRPNFIKGDIFKLESSKKFDNIWLSNIGAYIKNNDKLTHVISKVDSNLHKDGQLLISYLYAIDRLCGYNEITNPVYDVEKVFELLHKFNPSIDYIEGVSKNDTDAVLTYKKRRW
jgi:hypothetical protein